MSNKNEVMTPQEFYESIGILNGHPIFIPTPENTTQYAEYFHNAMIQKSETGMSAQEYYSSLEKNNGRLNPPVEKLMTDYAAYKLQAGTVDEEAFKNWCITETKILVEDIFKVVDYLRSRLSTVSAEDIPSVEQTIASTNAG